jgi:quercetin dioxygenase-like cupin family protein
MVGIEKKSLDSPDETRTPDKTKVEVVNLGSATVARMEMQPGWRWSECIRPVVGGDSCQVRHVGYVVSGTLHVERPDGTEQELQSGDAYVIEPGHDAWVVGAEPWVALEFESKTAAEYAKGRR